MPMTIEKQQLLEKNGMKLVPLWQFIIALIILLVSLGVAYGVGTQRVSENEKKINELELWKEHHNDFASEAMIALEKRLTSMETKLDYLVKENEKLKK